MKLIKINTDHYIVVDNSEIKEGDWQLSNGKYITIRTNSFHESDKKITHSTQPLGKPMLFTNAFESDISITSNGLQDTVIENWGCKKLSLSEVKELIGEVDVEKNMWYERNVQNPYPSDSLLHTGFNKGFELGYNQALKDNKEKKYTEEDMRKAIKMLRRNWNDEIVNEDKIIQSLQPKTEWDVEIEMEDSFTKNDEVYVDENNAKGNYYTHSKKPKLDANGCLILKLKSE